jgi:transcriptional regulator with XRE-family HTH domain
MKRSRKTILDPHAILLQRIERAGSQKALADELGVTQSYLSDVKLRRRGFSAALLEKLGLTFAAVLDR